MLRCCALFLHRILSIQREECCTEVPCEQSNSFFVRVIQQVIGYSVFLILIFRLLRGVFNLQIVHSTFEVIQTANQWINVLACSRVYLFSEEPEWIASIWHVSVMNCQEFRYQIIPLVPDSCLVFQRRVQFWSYGNILIGIDNELAEVPVRSLIETPSHSFSYFEMLHCVWISPHNVVNDFE